MANSSNIFSTRELIVVTNNRDDFLALLGGFELHPGLVIIVDNVRRQLQMALFERSLVEIRGMPSMINRIVEVFRSGSVLIYDLPPMEERGA